MRLALVALAIATALGLVACGSNKQSPAEAKQQLCSSVNAFAASVTSLQGVGLSSSEDQLNSALDNVQKAWDNVVADAKNVKTVNTDNIKQTYNDLKSGVQNRPTDEPVQQVVAGLAPKFTAFADAWRQFASSLQCKSSS
jgi:gamma-glutamyl:cysteine ligase YbdK (ATP-grasp superfamily)